MNLAHSSMRFTNSFLVLFVSLHIHYSFQEDSTDVKIKGDIVLGGLFPVHEDASSAGRQCGTIKPDKGVQRLEAMLFAMEQINKNGSILPNVTLGAHILDTCNQDTHALEQTLKFIKNSLSQDNMEFYQCPSNSSIINMAPIPVTAVVGAASSQVSAMVANVLRLFKVSYMLCKSRKLFYYVTKGFR